MGETYPDTKTLQHILATAKKGGMRSDMVDALLYAAQTIDATPLNLEGLLPVKINDWPCIIEAGDIPDPMTLDTANRMAQAEADDEGVPVRFYYQGAGFIAYPNAGIKADPAIPMFHQTAVTFTGAQRGGKTARMKTDMEKTLMEILAKDGGDHE